MSMLPADIHRRLERPARAPMRRGREPSMDLPPDKTCADCAHCRRCCAIFGHIPQDEVCDWAPSRFRPLAVVR